MEPKETIADYIYRLKEYNRRLLTNCYLSEDELSKMIVSQNVLFEYKENGYINIICSDNDFYRLYYYIADINVYKISFTGKPILCDVFTKDGNELYFMLKRALENQGLTPYATYYKLRTKASDLALPVPEESPVVDYESKILFRKDILNHFDKYTENVPPMEILPEFLKSRHCLSIYNDKAKEQFIGIIVYAKNGNSFFTDFVYVDEAFAGKGWGTLLYHLYFSETRSQAYQYETWVNSSNKASLKLHYKCGFQKQKIQKITFISGI